MYKYAGIFMISAACASFGVTSAVGMKRHIELLAALCGSLRYISAEIGTRLRPLPELIAELAGRGGAAGEFYTRLAEKLDSIGKVDFSALWASSLECLTPLNRDELSAMLALGDVLGRYELNEQLESIDICLDSLSRSLRGLQAQYPERRRLVLGLSAAAGILVLIVLI